MNICPECRERYSEKVVAKKTTVPEGAKSCYHDVDFEGDTRAGVWYIHRSEIGEGPDTEAR